jgi:hypothetical protein
MVTDPTSIKKDMSRAADVVRDMLEEKYVERIKDAVRYHKTKSRKNPSKEVTLIQALKNFMPPDQHERADKLIEAMTFADTLKSIGVRIGSADYCGNDVKSASVHEDGVYDIDDACARAKNVGGALGLILLISVMSGSL